MRLANKILHELGATQVFKVEQFKDPQTEEEFNLLEYESPVIITWQQYQGKYSEVEQKFGIRYLREYRNNLLSRTDWVMTVDSYQTLSNKEEWITYRQLLRDLPSNPPPFVWKEDGGLDVENMILPIQPLVVRITN